MNHLKKHRSVLTFVVLMLLISSFKYASWEDIKSKISQKVDNICKIVLDISHPFSTFKDGELESFSPYGETTGYDAESNSYTYNLVVNFSVSYDGKWVKNHEMKFAVYFNYLMPKDIKLISDNGVKSFSFGWIRKMIGKFRDNGLE